MSGMSTRSWTHTTISRSADLRTALKNAAVTLDLAVDVAKSTHCTESSQSQQRRTHWVCETDSANACLLENQALSILRFHCERLGLDVAEHGVEWWVRVQSGAEEKLGGAASANSPNTKNSAGQCSSERGRPTPSADRRTSGEGGIARGEAPSAETENDAPCTFTLQQRHGKFGGLALSGNQAMPFHFDKDEEVYSAFRRYFHPVIATVTYFSESVGQAPTVVLDVETSEGGELSKRVVQNATISWPRPGKHLSFPGGWMHGVPVPGRPSDGSHAGRVSFMANIWRMDRRPVRIDRLPEELRSLASRSDGVDVWPLGAGDEDVSFEAPVEHCQPVRYPFRQARLEVAIETASTRGITLDDVIECIVHHVHDDKVAVCTVLSTPLDEILDEVESAVRTVYIDPKLLSGDSNFIIHLCLNLVLNLRLEFNPTTVTAPSTHRITGPDIGVFRTTCSVRVEDTGQHHATPTSQDEGENRATGNVFGGRDTEHRVHDDVTSGLERFPIPAFDAFATGEVPVGDFVYTVHNVAEGGRDLQAAGSLESDGCGCGTGCTADRGCPCASREKEGDARYECTAACSCTDDCVFRATQQGVAIRTEVFRTASRGWGLRTVDRVEPGKFCLSYNGEVLKKAAATERLDQVDRARAENYLLVLAEHSGDRVYKTHIDAKHIGSAARFINHSCDPNLEMCPVRTNSVVPVAALYARRRIAGGEELTFAYGQPCDASVLDRPSRECRCGSVRCAGRLPAQLV
eukprot:m.430530 g.430530  ORF g.430530 m.430530 type:complete len:747 (+) comp17179_c0_seq1:406-2646(+)